MLASPIVNAITFKDTSTQTYPNKSNFLHGNYKQSNAKIMSYSQRFNNSETVYLQFVSDSATLPSLVIYNPTPQTPIAGTLANTIVGTVTRYYYNFALDLTAYNDSGITMTIEQDAVTLTSEPICVSSVTEDLANGTLRYIKYNNSDRDNADLSGNFVDWANRDYMFFYVEAQDVEPNQSDENEVLRGAQSDTIISATLFTGVIFKTDPIPVYMFDKLAAVSSLDTFLMNNVQYVKDGETESELFGGSTSVQVTINLTEKNAIGVNVDDLGIESEDIVEWHKEDGGDGKTANFSVTEPAGYLVSDIMIEADATSVPASTTVEIGYVITGDDIASGAVAKVSTYPTIFDAQRRGSFDAASTIYFTFSGDAGYVLNVKVLFQLQDIS